MEEQWNFYRATIEGLYLTQDKPLKEVMSYMVENHQFQAR